MSLYKYDDYDYYYYYYYYYYFFIIIILIIQHRITIQKQQKKSEIKSSSLTIVCDIFDVAHVSRHPRYTAVSLGGIDSINIYSII